MEAFLDIQGRRIPVYLPPAKAIDEMASLGVDYAGINVMRWPMGGGRHGFGRFLVFERDLDLDESPDGIPLDLHLGGIRFADLRILRRSVFMSASGGKPMVLVDLVDDRYFWGIDGDRRRWNITNVDRETFEPTTIFTNGEPLTVDDMGRRLVEEGLPGGLDVWNWTLDLANGAEDLLLDVDAATLPAGVLVDRLLLFLGYALVVYPSVDWASRATLPEGISPSNPLETKYEIRPLDERGRLPEFVDAVKKRTAWVSLSGTADEEGLAAGGAGWRYAGGDVDRFRTRVPDVLRISYPAGRQGGVSTIGSGRASRIGFTANASDEFLDLVATPGDEETIPGGVWGIRDEAGELVNGEALAAHSAARAVAFYSRFHSAALNASIIGLEEFPLLAGFDEISFALDLPMTHIRGDVDAPRLSWNRGVPLVGTGGGMVHDHPIKAIVAPPAGSSSRVFAAVITGVFVENPTPLYSAAAIDDPGVAVVSAEPINRPVDTEFVDVEPAAVGALCLILVRGDGSRSLVAWEKIRTEPCDAGIATLDAGTRTIPESFTAGILGV